MINTIGIIGANYRCDLLEQLSINRPIASIPFVGRYRLMDFSLSAMVNSGIRTVGIVTPHQFRSILDHLGAGKEWSLDRKAGGLFILPGATQDLQFRIYKFCLKDLRANMEFLLSDSADYVMITGCNHVFNLNFNDILEHHANEDADVTMVYTARKPGYTNNTALLSIDDQHCVTNVLKAGERTENTAAFRDEQGEERHFSDIFIFKRKLLIKMIEACANVEVTDLIDVIRANLSQLRVTTYEAKGYMGQIYSVADYYKCSMDILNLDMRNEIFMGDNRVYTKIKDNPPTRYGRESAISNSLVSSGCIIDGEVSNSIIFRGCHIAKGTAVRNSIIMQKCTIGEGTVLENVIFDKQVAITSDTVLKGHKHRPLLVPKNTVL